MARGMPIPLARPPEANIMPPMKTPTSSLSGSYAACFSLLHLTVITATVTELAVKRVWYRILAGIRRIFSGSAPPETSTARPSYFARLPVEILEMITVHLIYDKRSLLGCSLTCYSWYIVTVPHLHHTLITRTYCREPDKRIEWPKPLWDMYKLGLLPLVKKLHISGERFLDRDPPIFSPERFSWYTLPHFTALTNVQELGIDHLDIPGFIPKINRYFGHFLPTVRSLALRVPKGSRRQIVYFIGLFNHLEDLKLLYNMVDSPEGEPADDPTLVPPFIPPLRGRLTVINFTRVGILKDMIDLFGGIRFRYMSLFNVVGMRLLLDACAETLETLQLHPFDPRGKELSLSGLQVLTGDFTGVSSIRNFDLSRNKILRTLEVTERGIICGLYKGGPSYSSTGPFAYALSTITSPAFTEVIVFHRDYDFLGVTNYGTLRQLSLSETSLDASWYDLLFRQLRMMRTVRDFQLVLCVDAWDRLGEQVLGVLKQALAAEGVERGFDDTFPEPLVTRNRRGPRYRSMESSALFSKPWIPL